MSVSVRNIQNTLPNVATPEFILRKPEVRNSAGRPKKVREVVGWTLPAYYECHQRYLVGRAHPTNPAILKH
jgi:hypothetical protein